MTQASRRQMMKVLVAGAAMAATSTSFLDAAFGAADSGAMALEGGGSLLVYRRDDGWVGIVIDPVGERIPEPNGWVVVEGGKLIGLEKGIIIEGTVKTEDWIQEAGDGVVVFVQSPPDDKVLTTPLWSRGPVLASQAPLLERAAIEATEERIPTNMPEITPAVPGVTLPTPGTGVTPPASPAPRSTR